MVGWSFFMSKVGMTTFVTVWWSFVSPRSLLSSLRRYFPLYFGPDRSFGSLGNRAAKPLHLEWLLIATWNHSICSLKGKKIICRMQSSGIMSSLCYDLSICILLQTQREQFICPQADDNLGPIYSIMINHSYVLYVIYAYCQRGWIIPSTYCIKEV